MVARTITRPQVSKVKTLPPPLGGWNARDPLPSMAPDDAIVLDNIVPGTGAASLRLGFAEHVTGLSDYIETLMEHSPPSGSNKLFAATTDKIYDVTSAGAVGAAAVSSLSNGRWQHTMFATSGGNYLVCANGANSVRNYDGSSWTTPSITGATSANLIGVTAHAQRLWFIEKNKLDPWYLPVASIAGAATKLLIAPFCKLGGYLVAIASWTRDGGNGADDLICFITSKGEVVIYSGVNPDFDNGFQQVGVFRIAEPIGRRCVVKAGSDVGILTSIGPVPLSQVLPSSLSNQQTSSITDKIRNAFALAYASAKANFGWQVIEWPYRRLVFVNVPFTERALQYQYVMNVDTGAWCRFTGINAGCWSLLGDTLYFGGNDGTVYKYGTDFLDNEQVIPAVIQQGYTNFGTPKLKHFKAARPLFLGPNGYIPALEIKLDYDVTPVSLPTPPAPVGGTAWDDGDWDEAAWIASSIPTAIWQGAFGIGQTASVAMSFALGEPFQLNSTDVMYEEGGYF